MGTANSLHMRCSSYVSDDFYNYLWPRRLRALNFRNMCSRGQFGPSYCRKRFLTHILKSRLPSILGSAQNFEVYISIIRLPIELTSIMYILRLYRLPINMFFTPQG